MNPLIGRKVLAVYLAEDKKAMKFDVEGADPVIARADGDCCSSSWIEYIETPENLIGTVSAIEDVAMPDLGSPGDYEVIAYYGCKIQTDKGSCLLDYRNESNGYYGGSLEWEGAGRPAGYFYGGVFGQNVSKEEWRKIA